MLTDAEIRVRESVVLRVLDEQSAIITDAGFRELMADFRTLQQQNKQLLQYLERISVTFGEFECHRLAYEAIKSQGGGEDANS